MGDTSALTQLTQAGGIGVALAALGLLYKVSVLYNESMKDHADSNKLLAESNHMLSKNTAVNTEVLRSLKESFDSKLTYPHR